MIYDNHQKSNWYPSIVGYIQLMNTHKTRLFHSHFRWYVEKETNKYSIHFPHVIKYRPGDI